MDAIYRFFRKYLISTILILLLFLILNVALVVGVLLFANSKSSDPEIPIKEINNNIFMDDSGTIHAEETVQQILFQKQAWAMVLNESGDVIWQENMPAQLPTQYTSADIAKFSRWYLDESPVYVQENPAGLLVIGCAPNSLVKLNYSLDAAYISNILSGIAFVIVANIFLVLILSWRNTRKVELAIAPILQGITEVSEGRAINLPERGELAEINSRLNNAGQYIAQKEQARSEWISSVSHDVRTPLSYILGYAGKIEDNTELAPAIREQAEIIRKQGEHLRSLISDLNLTSKLEYSMQPLNLQTLYPVELARKTLVDFIEKDIDTKYTFEFQANQDAPRCSIQGDSSLLSRMLSNLIQNSITHNPDGCHITIVVAEEYHKCIFTIADNGLGSSDIMLKKLNLGDFNEQTYQMNGDTAHGLGLRIVHQIVKTHNGTIHFSNKNPHGFSVTITLPIYDTNS